MAISLIVTLITKPVSEEVLIKFYKKIQPGGNLWKPIAKKVPEIKIKAQLWRDLLDWLLGCVFIYCFLFGTGKILFGEILSGLLYLIGGIISMAIAYKDLHSRNWGVL